MTDVPNSTPPRGNSHSQSHTPNSNASSVTPNARHAGLDHIVRPSDFLRNQAPTRPVASQRPIPLIEEDERAGLVSVLSSDPLRVLTCWTVVRHKKFPESSRLL